MPNESLNLSLDEELVTYRRRRSRSDRKPPFFICGLGGNNRHGESMDLIDTLLGMPTASGKLFRAMLKVRNVETNEVARTALLQQPGIDPRYIQNHMPAVIESGLVRRIQRGHFIINPYAVMPPNGDNARAIWHGVINHDLTETEPAPV
jgi:hypothetical protein